MPKIHEDDLHCALAQWLTETQKVNGLWWHTPNTHSSVRHAVKLKRMGMRAGVFDFQFVRSDAFLSFLELKMPLRYLNADQKKFMEFLDSSGIPYAIIKTDQTDVMIQQARDFLRRHEFLS